MTGGQPKVPCAACGEPVDALRAPRVRFCADRQWVFCCAAHADGFVLPRHRPVVSSEGTKATQAGPSPKEALSASFGSSLGVSVSPPSGTNYDRSPDPPLVEAEPIPAAAPAPHRLDAVHEVSESNWEGAPLEQNSEQQPSPLGEEDKSSATMVSNEDSGSEPAGTEESIELLDRGDHERFAPAFDGPGARPVELDETSLTHPRRPVSPPLVEPRHLGEEEEISSDGASSVEEGGFLGGGIGALEYVPLLLLAVTSLVSLYLDQPSFGPAAALCVLLVIVVVQRRFLAQSERLDWPEVLSGDKDPLARIRQGEVEVEKLASCLKAGEEVVVEAGQWILVDGVVSGGSARLIPWPGAKEPVSFQVGTRVVAGAYVQSGSLSIVATKTAGRRAFVYPSRFLREHVLMTWARGARIIVGPLVGSLAGLFVYLQSDNSILALSTAAAVSGGYVSSAGAQICRLLLLRAWGEAARRGIAYCDAAQFERAGQANAVVFNARGTVLYGEPDVAEIHVFREEGEERVLSLAAGAESAVHHPIASSTLRAAHHRGVVVDRCRGHHVIAGLGVLCSSSEGGSVVVGSRELLLRERISVAVAEEQLRLLEARGMSTLLVALDGRLIGVLGLQDSLRAGARATFQLLIDSHLEPILLSGDARATTEAVARALSCEHVRPEVPALARAQEVRSLIDAGLTVAAVGNSPRDDVALGAAHIPVILEGASVIRADSPHSHERGIGISSDRVLDAAMALLIARRARALLLSCLFLWLLLTTVGALVVMSQLAPIYAAPLFALLGLGVSFFRAKRRDWSSYPP